MYYFVQSTYQVHTMIDGDSHRWTAAELEKVIEMLHNPEFDSKDMILIFISEWPKLLMMVA